MNVWMKFYFILRYLTAKNKGLDAFILLMLA